MEIEDVLREIKALGSVLSKEYLGPFCETIDEISTTTAVEQPDGGHLRILADKIKPSLRTKIGKGHEILQKHSAKITQKQTDVSQLLEVREKLKTEIESKEKDLQKKKRQRQDYEEKLNNFQCLEDCVQTCKILTGTHFGFKKGNTIGYIKDQNSPCFEVFDFNNLEVNQQDITTKLWTLLKNVSKEDHENQMVQRSNNINKKIIIS